MTKTLNVKTETSALLAKLGVSAASLSGGDLTVRSPVTGEQIAALKTISPVAAGKAIDAAHEAFKAWRLVPGPRRGELVRLLGEELRVRVARVDPEEAKIDLALESQPAAVQQAAPRKVAPGKAKPPNRRRR